MRKSELKEVVLEQFKLTKIHPLHDLMLDECCENALKNDVDKEILVQAVNIAFLTSNSTLKAVLKSALSKADNVNLEYRGENFTFDESSQFLK